MFVKSYKIAEPKRFEIFVEDIYEEDVLVRPEYLAICKADIRYYMGDRDRTTLKRKFPMSLIHEATGVVMRDVSDTFKAGQRVILLPCIKSQCDGSKCKVCVRDNDALLDNYCPESSFRSSNYDGFSKELTNCKAENLVAIPDEIGIEAVFSELISVGCCAMRRAGITEGSCDTISVWGDGIMGYIIALVAKYGIGADVKVIGHDKEKLKMFDFAETFDTDDIDLLSKTDIAVEAVGGHNSSVAINQAIDKLYAGGKIILCGVSNENAPINTRMVLERGLTLVGTTRSVRCDFEKAVELLQIPEFRERIVKLIEGVDEIDNINKYYKAFDVASKSRSLGKRILKLVF